MTEVPVPAPTPTGIDAVDRVLDLVAGLDRRPLEEHAGVLEEAHAELRRTLDHPPAAAPAAAAAPGLAPTPTPAVTP
ncbi:hypothetical protein F9L07_06680 [Pimelobacter simplex]|uniref:Uncharacterized protein n=1 Tax=Nocardioides simplex TaxID=2045 RepID=A0A7J5E080_NOCSI|nr:hypothetical protein [Pimelobacter simplex]KAB2811553.1 hypothetical protein F9L07_06680 [Pimelobacter simplex]